MQSLSIHHLETPNLSQGMISLEENRDHAWLGNKSQIRNWPILSHSRLASQLVKPSLNFNMT